MVIETDDALFARARALVARGGRQILGIAGPPGGGKSTVARAVVAELGPAARLVPMDGFHLAQAELVRLGRADRKGALDTFDGAGYVALLRRLRENTDDVVYAPDFRREIEEPVNGAVAVPRDVPLVITEGNYLLHDVGPWAGAARLLDETWYVDIDDAVREERLVRRHEQFGRSTEAARAWVASTDAPNARLIAATKARADHVLAWS